MRKMLLPAILAFAGAACTSLPVMAGFSYDDLITRPYVIEKTCDDDYGNCQARMRYAPGENPGLAGPGSYWYPIGYHRHHARRSYRKHVRWCHSHYRTYDPGTDLFVGKGYRHYRCNSPYDGI